MYFLECLQMSSGLKVNPSKTKLYGIEVKVEEVEGWASFLRCRAEKIQFIYLGLPVGSSMRMKVHWHPVLEKFNSRLADWKARIISFGGRLTLVKSVI